MFEHLNPNSSAFFQRLKNSLSSVILYCMQIGNWATRKEKSKITKKKKKKKKKKTQKLKQKKKSLEQLNLQFQNSRII